MDKRFPLLAFDSLAALSAGCITLLSASQILILYKWPQEFTRFIGLANLGYGLYSGFLAILLRKQGYLSRWMVSLLVFANGSWSMHCFFQAWRVRSEASHPGIGHLVSEGVFVGLLACLEAKIILPYAGRAAPTR